MAKVNLDFANYITPRQTTRSPLAGFIQSKLRGVIDHSDDANGSAPAEAFYPYRYLPVWMVDTTLDDGIVIPKGSIVSVLSTKSSQAHLGFGEVVTATGVFVGIDFEGAAIKVNIDSNFFGYSDAIAGLLICANGGVDASGGNTALDQYTSLDTGRTINPTGGSATLVNIAAGGANVDVPFTRAPNYPVGIVTGDVYQDIRGANLNYQVWNIWGIKSRGYIEVPFVDLWAAAVGGNNQNETLANVLDSVGTDDTILADAPWYVEVARKHAFLYNPANSENNLVPGSLFKSDLYGKFIPEYVVPVTMQTGGFRYGTEGQNMLKALGTVTNDAVLTAQTVGRLVITDSRFPKDMLETVSTYPASSMPGTDTAGLPAPLFNFVRDVMIESAFAAAPTLVQILDNVQNGVFGVARLQLVTA